MEHVNSGKWKNIVKMTIFQNGVFWKLLSFTGVVFSCYFLKYGIWDLIVWPHILLISDWTAAKCWEGILGEVQEHFLFNLTTHEATVLSTSLSVFLPWWCEMVLGEDSTLKTLLKTITWTLIYWLETISYTVLQRVINHHS